MSKYLKLLMIVALSGIFSSSLAWADQVVAKKGGVKVYDSATKKGKVIKKLEKGDTLDSQKREGVFWQVSVDGKTGYVSILQVKRISGANNKISGAIREAVQEDREGGANTARARSAVMGVRGLSSSDDTSYIANVRPDFDGVYAMEDMNFGDSDVEKMGEVVFREIAAQAEEP